MKNFLKNFGILVGILIISYLTASLFGNWYDKFSPQSGSAFWGPTRTETISFMGFFIAYIFFIPLVYGLLGIKKNKHWIIWPLLPAALLMFGADKYHFYIPALLIIGALALAWLIRFIISKFKHPNPPMVVSK